MSALTGAMLVGFAVGGCTTINPEAFAQAPAVSVAPPLLEWEWLATRLNEKCGVVWGPAAADFIRASNLSKSDRAIEQEFCRAVAISASRANQPAQQSSVAGTSFVGMQAQAVRNYTVDVTATVRGYRVEVRVNLLKLKSAGYLPN